MPDTSVGSATSPVVIGIATTLIVHSRNVGAKARLSSIVREIDGGRLVLGAEAQFGGAEGNAVIEFPMDPDTGNYVAGAAYLWD